MINNFHKKMLKMILSVALVLCCSACSANNTADTSTYTRSGDMSPVDNYNAKEQKNYTDEGIKEKKTASFSSEDSLCIIDVYPSYYDVTLDFENGDRKSVGVAYADTIIKAYPDCVLKMEPYLYENIDSVFSGKGEKNYKGVEERLNELYKNIPEDYKQEIEGFAEKISDGEKGFKLNGKVSYEEALIMQMIPDAIRPTSCSALSLWGEKTVSGKGITLRSLEWPLGSENQMCYINAVVHIKNKEKSLTAFSYLGLFNIISAVNDDGVFAAILDADSGEEFVYKNKKCYTHELRYALENFKTAEELGRYMNEQSGDFTFCHSLMITDENKSFQAEDCTKEVAEAGLGFSNLRDVNTPIHEGISWDNPYSLCIVNSFTTAGNLDSFSGVPANIIRFSKYNEFVSARENFSVKDVKDMITSENIDQYKLETVHRNSVAQLIIIDYDKKNMQVAFTGKDGAVNKPDFIDLGKY